jgi:two-component system response regulator PilR (NtrC family)
LENIVERAITLCSGSTVELSDLPDDVALSSAPAETFEWLAFYDGGIDLDGRLQKLERALITEALARSNGNKTVASKELGISFRSMRYRLEKLGMESEE